MCSLLGGGQKIFSKVYFDPRNRYRMVGSKKIVKEYFVRKSFFRPLGPPKDRENRVNAVKTYTACTNEIFVQFLRSNSS